MKIKYTCSKCGGITSTTNTRKHDSCILRRQTCKDCGIVYVVVYKNDEPHLVNAYEKRTIKRYDLESL